MIARAAISRRHYLVSLAVALLAAPALAQSTEPLPYRELFYPSGTLSIQAYLYQPPGNGPFPVVIYNHGSRIGRERESRPFPHIARVLLPAGYAVLMPERRGYGRSGGAAFSEEVTTDPISPGRWGSRSPGDRPNFVSRMQAEAEDVLAAVDFLATLPIVDRTRLAIMGWSFGGIVTMLAASRSNAFRAVVDQAGGALSWDNSPALQQALIAAAGLIRAPVLLMVAENDRTTASVTTLAGVLRERNPAAELIVYPPFTPASNPRGVPPGHLLFSYEGAAIWESDVRAFLAKHLAGRAAAFR